VGVEVVFVATEGVFVVAEALVLAAIAPAIAAGAASGAVGVGPWPPMTGDGAPWGSGRASAGDWQVRSPKFAGGLGQ
jgi:hypothetical protein